MLVAKLLFFLPLVAAGAVLERWLEDLLVSLPAGTVPPIEADVKILLATVHVKATINALVCDGFQLKDVASEPKQGSVAVSARGGQATCRGQVDYSTSLGLKGSASAVLTTQEAQAQLALSIGPWSRETFEAPKLRTSSCQAALALELHITGGTFWTQFAELLPGVVQKLQSLANDKISEYLCGPALAAGREDLYQLMNRSLADARTVNESVPPLQENWVDWKEHTLTRGLVEFQEQFLEPSHAYDWLIGQRCVVGSSTTCFTPPLCLAVNESCAAKNGSFGVSLPEMKWNLSDFAITPLMLQNASLATKLQATQWHLWPVVNLSYQPEDGDTEAELVHLNLSFGAVVLSGNITAGVDAQSFSQVPSYEYLEARCLAGSTEYLGLSRMRASLQLQRFLPVMESPSLLASLLNLTSQLLDSGGLSNFTEVLLEGMVQNQFAQQLNNSMGRWLKNTALSECPLPKGLGVYEPVGRILIRPTFGRICCWVALGTALLALAMSFRCRPRGSANCLDGALCRSQSVPRRLAVMLPVMIIACLCFLLGSNYLLMAETFVNLEQAPSFVWNAYQVMVYSLFYSINALYYEAHLQAMSWVLLCFSAILPYVKLIMMFICWLTPKRLLPLRLRRWILVVMDEIGKFSLVDVFTVQFLSGVFYVEVAGVTEGQPLKVVLRTKEELGFAAFVFATVVSLIIGHFCRHFHEKSERCEAISCHGDIELQEQVTSLEQPLSGAEPRRRAWHELLIGPALLLILVLCVVGCFLPAYTVHLRTVFGSLGDSETSLFRFACDLPLFAEHPQSFAAVFNQVTFVIFAMGVNFLQLVLLLLLWYGWAPWLHERVNVLEVAHCLGAWAALDVALISMIITMLELKQSDFVHLGSAQKEQLSRLSGIDVRGGDKGLTVDVTLGSGTYILFVAVLLHAVVSRAALARERS